MVKDFKTSIRFGGLIMSRFCYAIRIGLIAFLVYCTMQYIIPMPNEKLYILIYSAVLGILVILFSYFLVGKPPKVMKHSKKDKKF